MIVFKSFFKVLRNYKMSLIMYLVISLGVIYILSSFNTKGNATYYRVSQGIAVQDNDKSEISKGLIEYLSTINGIKNAADYTDDQITDMIYYTKLSNRLLIPAGFGEAYLNGADTAALKIESTKEAGARMGYSVETEIDSYLNLLSGYLAGGFNVEEAQKLTMEALADNSAVSVVADVKVEDDKIFTIFQMLPYGILTMLFSAVLPVILRFGSMLLKKRSDISSTPVLKRQISIALAAGVVSVFIVIALITLASVLSEEAFTGRWWLIVLNLVTLSLTVVMLVVAVSNLNMKPEVSAGFTNVVGLSFSFLGGIFVPIEYLGSGAKVIGQFLPTYWYSEAMTRIKTGGGFNDILNCLLIQLLFGVMVMGVGLVAGRCIEKRTA
ncbi:MAG: ABC transporter permease [Lachnospiraceae bacterium]|nr:ABC transporter permease [Lachnospiraceae bacterium]